MRVSDLYCPSCRNAKDHKPQDNEVCWSCMAMGGAGNYKESKTHGDQFRAMTDEELVEIFANNDCGYCRIHDFCFAKGSAINCEDVWLEWLKEEVTE